MTEKELILKEVERLPEECLGELWRMIQKLRTKASPKPVETALASERVLAKEWLLEEEDEAWQDL